MDRLTKAQLEFMNGYVPANIHDIYEYATGGGIHIKPSHEGRFTAYKKRTGKTTEEALHSKDPHVRQMANFARNAAKWKHQDGGTAGGQDEIVQQIAQALQKGAKPKQILQELVKMGMSQDQATQTVQSVIDQMQGKMQEGGPSPQGQPQPGGPEPNGVQEYPEGHQSPQGNSVDPQQLIQAVQQMIQQGATPEDVISELLNEQVDPQMIVQILVQLGMPQQEVVQDIQNIMSQSQQGAGAPQEQENPQEQMQEQGQEEPQGPPMAFGGTPRFDWGGFNYPNEYRAPGILNHSKFNSNALGMNALVDPAVSGIPAASAALGNTKAGALLDIVSGTLAAPSGVYAGYAGLFHNNKKDYGQFFHDANQNASKIPGSITLPKPTDPSKLWDKYGTERNALWDKYNPKQDPFKVSNYGNWKPGMQVGGEYEIGDDVYTTTPSVNPVIIPTSGSYPTSYQNLPDNMQPMKVSRVDANGKPLSRNEIAVNQQEYNRQRNVQPEYEHLNRMFNWMAANNGTEQDYYDAHKHSDKYNVTGNDSCDKKGGYCGAAAGLQKQLNGKKHGGELPHAQVGIPPGFVDGMGVDQPGYGETRDIMSQDTPTYNELRVPYTSSNKNNNSVNANKKVLNTYNMSGKAIATNTLNALGLVNTGLGIYDNDKKAKEAYNHAKFQFGQGRMMSDVYNSPNANGDWTVNSGKLKANMYVPTQDFGTSQYAKYGGSTQYQKGGEYHVTHDELLHLMRNGAEVEFL